MAKRKAERLRCEKCGSTMFTEGRFRQYRKVPSSLPYIGDEWSLIKDKGGIRCLTCICGHPVRLGRLRRQVPGDQESFGDSFEKAVRETADSRTVVERLYARFAGKPQHLDLAGQVTSMEDTVQAIRLRRG